MRVYSLPGSSPSPSPPSCSSSNANSASTLHQRGLAGFFGHSLLWISRVSNILHSVYHLLTASLWSLFTSSHRASIAALTSFFRACNWWFLSFWACCCSLYSFCCFIAASNSLEVSTIPFPLNKVEWSSFFLFSFNQSDSFNFSRVICWRTSWAFAPSTIICIATTISWARHRLTCKSWQWVFQSCLLTQFAALSKQRFQSGWRRVERLSMIGAKISWFASAEVSLAFESGRDPVEVNIIAECINQICFEGVYKLGSISGSEIQ